jgi:YggT family protein
MTQFLALFFQASELTLNILALLIFLDLILSWLAVAGIFIYLAPMRALLDPLYNGVRKYIPTTFGPVDFTPFVIVLGINLLESLLVSLRLAML